MSARQVLMTVDGLLRDGNLGFVKALTDLIAASAPPGGVQLQTVTDITRKRPSEKMAPATKARLALTLASATQDLVQPGAKDGAVGLAFRYETFEANEDNLEYQVAYAASALSRVVLENLRAYSDAHQGTVVDIAQPLSFQFGEFDGPVSAGFILTAQITERSSE